MCAAVDLDLGFGHPKSFRQCLNKFGVRLAINRRRHEPDPQFGCILRCNNLKSGTARLDPHRNNDVTAGTNRDPGRQFRPLATHVPTIALDPDARLANSPTDNRLMLAYQDEAPRPMFAVYVRPEGQNGTISFYADEAQAVTEVGPSMPTGIITHGDTYIEHVGDVTLFAPVDWPLLDVDPDLLVELETPSGTVFVGLTHAESEALLAVATVEVDDTLVEEPSDVDIELVPAPDGHTGSQPTAAWFPDGSIVVFPTGFDDGGLELPEPVERSDFGDEIRADQAVVALLEYGHLPLADDEYTWVESGEVWIMNTQPRIADDTEQFFCRYTNADRTLAITRCAADTDDEELHLQLVSNDAEPDFIDLGILLTKAGWRIDGESLSAAELSANPKLRQSPGWYPAEPDEDSSAPAVTDIEDVSEWVCVVARS